MNHSFTLLEVLVAIFIFTVGIVGVWLLIQQPLVYSQNLSRQLIAVYLAQEGIEIVKNIRDSNLLKKCYISTSTQWYEGLVIEQGVGPEPPKEADYTNWKLSPYEGRFLTINSNGFYGYSNDSGVEKTLFKRKIEIYPITVGPVNRLPVKVDILYGDKEEKIFSLQGVIFDLYQTVRDFASSTGNSCLEDQQQAGDVFILPSTSPE